MRTRAGRAVAILYPAHRGRGCVQDRQGRPAAASQPPSTDRAGRSAHLGRLLAYCLHVTLRARLKPLANGLTPRAVLDKFAAVQMLGVHFPTTDGRNGRTLVLSRYTELNLDQKILVRQLNLELPPQPHHGLPPPATSLGCLHTPCGEDFFDRLPVLQALYATLTPRVGRVGSVPASCRGSRVNAASSVSRRASFTKSRESSGFNARAHVARLLNRRQCRSPVSWEPAGGAQPTLRSPAIAREPHTRARHCRRDAIGFHLRRGRQRRNGDRTGRSDRFCAEPI